MEGRGCRWSSGRRRRERKHGKVYLRKLESLGLMHDKWGGWVRPWPGAPATIKKVIGPQWRLLTPSGSIVLQSAFRVVEPPLASSWSPLHHGLLLLATDVFTHVHPKSLGAAFSVFRSCSRCVTRPGRSSQGQSPPCLQTMPSIRTSMMWWSLGVGPPSQISSPPVGGSVLCLLLVYNWPGELFVAACISLDPSFSVHSSTCFHEA